MLFLPDKLRDLLLNVDTFRCFQEHNIPTPKFGVARTPEDAKKIASELDCVDLVVKAQVLYICSICTQCVTCTVYNLYCV